MVVTLLLSAASLAIPDAAANVAFSAHGSWAGTPVQIPGAVDTDYSIWVDLSVYNLAYTKDVGIRWTDDGWTTWHDASAWYEGSLGNNWERWGVDIQPLGTRSTDGQTVKWENFYGGWSDVAGPVTVEYAIYYRAAGGEWWDSNGGQNYRLTLW